MIILVFLIIPFTAFANDFSASPLPIFIKQGFSSVLEFDSSPTHVVLGDTQSFQVEKLKRSIIIRSLVEETSSNLFVYFRDIDPMLFILTVSEDAKPTLYKKFVSMKKVAQAMKAKERKVKRYKRSTRLINSNFDKTKDFLTLEIAMMADSRSSIRPLWDKVHLSHKGKAIKPSSMWSQRKVIQKDSRVLARFVFTRPNIPRNLKATNLLIPISGYKNPIKLKMPVRLR